jgi:type II secretory pathway component GspD/PulD (secretin)
MQHRVAAELVPLIETALAGEGTASVDETTNSLILKGEPRAIAVALQLLVVQDRARRSVLVEAWSQRRSELSEAGYSVDWVPEAGAVRLGRLQGAEAAAAPTQGTQARVLGSGATAPAKRIRSQKDAEFATTLEILEGELGRIACGRVVPFVTRGEGGATTTIIETRSGLLARPHVLGNSHVQLDLAPFDASSEDGGTASFSSISTRVVLGSGETVVVGGVQSQARNEESDPQAASHRGRRDEALLLLRVEID